MTGPTDSADGPSAGGVAKRRGRPLVFDEPTRRRLAELIAEHGIAGARARADMPVSQGTLIKIAKEFSINLKSGRRRLSTTESVAPSLDDGQLAHLRGLLQHGPRHFGYRSDRWTKRRVCELIHREFAVRCLTPHLDALRDRLGGIRGLTWGRLKAECR